MLLLSQYLSLSNILKAKYSGSQCWLHYVKQFVRVFTFSGGQTRYLCFYVFIHLWALKTPNEKEKKKQTTTTATITTERFCEVESVSSWRYLLCAAQQTAMQFSRIVELYFYVVVVFFFFLSWKSSFVTWWVLFVCAHMIGVECFENELLFLARVKERAITPNPTDNCIKIGNTLVHFDYFSIFLILYIYVFLSHF